MRIARSMSLLMKVWPPMLATLAEVDEVGADYDILEAKYDGFRALAGVAKDGVSLQSRNALDLSQRFPAVAMALGDLKARECVLDGELIAHRGRDFHSLQTGSSNVDYVIFDLLLLDGADLREQPLSARRAALESLLEGVATNGGRLRLGERLRGPAAKALLRAKSSGLEGVVCKRSGSRYLGGRQREWLKLKVLHADEFYIAGFVPHSSGSSQIGSLVLATMEKKPRFAGKVGTGFSNAMRTELFQQLVRLHHDRDLKSDAIADAPRERGIVWCKPELVAEIAYSEVTPDGRLRHPSFQRLREDKQELKPV